MHWLVRPIAFLEACRRRHGDAFSVRFLGFQTPLVMVSSPEAIRALYSEAGHQLPPGRTLSLRPIVGPRSVLLLEGAEHLSRRRLMLPPFHGDRMRAYEPTVREATEREIARWPADRPFAVHPSMQAITLEVILRAVFGVADAERRERLRARLVELLGSTASAGLQFSVLLARRLGTQGSAAEDAGAHGGDRRDPRRGDRRPPGRRARRRRRATTSARCWSRRASRTAGRWRTARSATS